MRGSNENDSISLGRMTGIRSWTGLSRSLAAVVMTVQEVTMSPFGSRQVTVFKSSFGR